MTWARRIRAWSPSRDEGIRDDRRYPEGRRGAREAPFSSCSTRSRSAQRRDRPVGEVRGAGRGPPAASRVEPTYTAYKAARALEYVPVAGQQSSLTRSNSSSKRKGSTARIWTARTTAVPIFRAAGLVIGVPVARASRVLHDEKCRRSPSLPWGADHLLNASVAAGILMYKIAGKTITPLFIQIRNRKGDETMSIFRLISTSLSVPPKKGEPSAKNPCRKRAGRADGYQRGCRGIILQNLSRTATAWRRSTPIYDFCINEQLGAHRGRGRLKA